jgi:hypothetical protein
VLQDEILQSELSHPGFSLAKNQPYLTKQGVVQCFKCSGKKRFGCDFKAKVVFEDNSSTISVFSCGTHQHGHEVAAKTGLPPKHKLVVEEAVQDGLDAAVIHRKIQSYSPSTKVSLKQVQTAVKRTRKMLFSSLAGNTIGDLYEWCHDHELTATSEDHEFGVLPLWNAHGPANLMDEAANVCFVLTTKNLLRNAIRQQNGKLPSFMDFDHTYKLCDNGYPITIIGTVDANHTFKLVAVGITRFENSSAVSKVVDSVKAGMELLLNFNLDPAFAMG